MQRSIATRRRSIVSISTRSPSEPRTSTTNAALQPHFTPSRGRPSSDSASGRPSCRRRSKPRRASGGSRIHGAPRLVSKGSCSAGTCHATPHEAVSCTDVSTSARCMLTRGVAGEAERRSPMDRPRRRKRRTHARGPRRNELRPAASIAAPPPASDRQLHQSRSAIVPPEPKLERTFDEQRRDIDLRRESASAPARSRRAPRPPLAQPRTRVDTPFAATPESGERAPTAGCRRRVQIRPGPRCRENAWRSRTEARRRRGLGGEACESSGPASATRLLYLARPETAGRDRRTSRALVARRVRRGVWP